MTHSVDRLVYMANQIARELSNQHPNEAATASRDHLQRYWDPRMRRLIIQHLSSGGAGLNDTARDAVAMLDEHEVPEPANKRPSSDLRPDVG